MLAYLVIAYDEDIECFDTGICISRPKSMLTKSLNPSSSSSMINGNSISNKDDKNDKDGILSKSKNNQCSDRHEECKSLASHGHCDLSPGWMIVNCPNSCERCHLREHSVRCQRSFLNISDTPVQYYPIFCSIL